MSGGTSTEAGPSERRSAHRLEVLDAGKDDGGLQRVALTILKAAASKGSLPGILLLLLSVFLLSQDAIDRRDPKLAMAPVYGEPDVPFRHLRDGGR